MSQTLKREPCLACGSKDNLTTWEYNQKRFVKCQTENCPNSRATCLDNINSNSLESRGIKSQDIIEEFTPITSGNYEDILDRGLSKNTCATARYQIAEFKGKKVHVANYVDFEGKICAQKIRFIDKKGFIWHGDSSKVILWCIDLLQKDSNTVYITEGEIDCLSLKEIGIKNVISLKDGAGEGKFKQLIPFINLLREYKEIILCFDNDEVGQKTARDVAELFTPGKCKVVPLGVKKDVNEYLQENDFIGLKECLNNAYKYIPEALKQPSLESLLVLEPLGVNLPFKGLNSVIKGLKQGRIYTLLAGSKIGKSTFTKELIYHIASTTELNSGVAYLEESQKLSAQSFIAIDQNKPWFEVEENPGIIPIDKFKDSYNKLINKRIFTLNAAFLKLTGSQLLHYLQWLIDGFKCQVLVLDHITMVTYDMGGENNERKDLDILMKNLRALTNKTKCTIILVSHLSRPKFGKGFSEGREVKLEDARSSGAVEQVSDVIIALERNMTEETSSKTKVKVLGNRITGKTGYTDELLYIENTGRLISL